MAFLPRPVTRMMLSTPEATASSTPYWMMGLSTSGSISFGCALVAGRNRVPRPAAGKTALRTFLIPSACYHSGLRRPSAGRRAILAGPPEARRAGLENRRREQGTRAREAGEPRAEPRADPV